MHPAGRNGIDTTTRGGRSGRYAVVFSNTIIVTRRRCRCRRTRRRVTAIFQRRQPPSHDTACVGLLLLLLGDSHGFRRAHHGSPPRHVRVDATGGGITQQRLGRCSSSSSTFVSLFRLLWMGFWEKDPLWKLIGFDFGRQIRSIIILVQVASFHVPDLYVMIFGRIYIGCCRGSRGNGRNRRSRSTSAVNVILEQRTFRRMTYGAQERQGALAESVTRTTAAAVERMLLARSKLHREENEKAQTKKIDPSICLPLLGSLCDQK